MIPTLHDTVMLSMSVNFNGNFNTLMNDSEVASFEQVSPDFLSGHLNRRELSTITVQSQSISRVNDRSRLNEVSIAPKQSEHVSVSSALVVRIYVESSYMYTVEDLTRLRLQVEDESNVYADLLAEKLNFFENHFLPIEYDRISVYNISIVDEHKDTASPSSSATTPEEVVVAITAAVRFFR